MPPNTPIGYDPLDLQAQAATKAAQGEAQQLQRRNEMEDIRWLMSDGRGRRIMWRLLELAGVYRLSFTGDASPLQMAFNEGQRNNGLKLLDDIMSGCPHRLEEMTAEHLENGRGSSNNPDRPKRKRRR